MKKYCLDFLMLIHRSTSSILKKNVKDIETSRHSPPIEKILPRSDQNSQKSANCIYTPKGHKLLITRPLPKLHMDIFNIIHIKIALVFLYLFFCKERSLTI